jgi:hypothetical protein
MTRPAPRLVHSTSLLALAAVLLAATGCKRQAPTTYTVPQEEEGKAPVAAQAPPAHGEGSPLDSTAPVPDVRPDFPQIAWELPAGWKATGPGQMTAATFAIEGQGGQASVSITPLPSMAGREAMIVNMWRGQAGAPELGPEEAAAALQPVEVSQQPGQLFEIAATSREGKAIRIVTAILNRTEGSWFFKLQGDEAAVSAQREAFLTFLKSFKFKEPPAVSQAERAERPEPATLPAMSSGPSAADLPTAEPYAAFPTPEGWRPVAAGQMQVAKFAVPVQGSARAEVAVSRFGNDTGGIDANVSRWRRQIGLPEIPEAELKAVPQPLDPALPGAVVADLQNESKRMIGAIVPRDGQWWFYKLNGDAEAVAAARETFLTFVKAAPKS